MAPPARLELTTLRLGGARSIRVSYGGMLLYDFNPSFSNCQSKLVNFLRNLLTLQPLWKIIFYYYFLSEDGTLNA